jgi:hypothetical protein
MGEVTLRPEAVAVHSLLALSTAATAGRLAMRTITPNQATALFPLVGGVYACNLPSPERKVRKMSHQEQLDKQNRSKRKAVHTQAHVQATTLVAKERVKSMDVRCTTMQVIQQVNEEFRARGYCISLSIPTINRYIALGMVGTFPLSWGYEGTISRHAFNVLVLAVDLFIQINQVNSVVVERSHILTKINECCSVPLQECQKKRSLYDRVLRAMTVSLNANVSPAVKEQRVWWTTYANLLKRFENFRTFLIKFDFAGVDMNGELEFAD